MVLPSLRYANGFCAAVKVLNNWHCMQLLAVLLILLGFCTHFDDECLGLFHPRLPKILSFLAQGTTKTWEFQAFPACELVFLVAMSSTLLGESFLTKSTI